MKSQYGRKTITHNTIAPRKIFLQAGERAFRGFVGGEAFITKQGYRGIAMDTIWSQQIFDAFESDDDELVTIALQSSLANIHDTVIGGEYGSPFAIGDYGFYAESQFLSQSEYLHQTERNNASSDIFLSQDEWSTIDQYLTKLAHHSQAKFQKVSRGDSFGSLAIRKDAYKVAIVFLQKGIDILAANEQEEDMIDILKEQYAILSTALKTILTKQIVFYHQTKTNNEINELRIQQTKIQQAFEGMIFFGKECLKYLERKVLEIEADLALKRQCELLHKPFPKEKEFNITRKDRAFRHRPELMEIIDYAQQKYQTCQQSFQEFEEKLQIFLERKVGLAKAIKRGATKDSLIVIAKQLGGSHDNDDLSQLRADEEDSKSPFAFIQLAITDATAKIAEESEHIEEKQQDQRNEDSEKQTKKVLGVLVQTEDTVVYYK